jgi:ABC-type nitrate/sulfonate/bicarbonate transport system substrate-binding protein/Tfp pilus assembly protein PilO
VNPILSAWQKLEYRDRRSIAILGIFVVLTGIYLFCIEPLYKQFNELKTAKSRIEKKIERNRAASASLPKREARLAEVKQEYEYLLGRLEVEKEGIENLVEIVTDIKDFSTDIGVDILHVKPLPKIEHDFFQEMPLEISLQCSFLQFQRFLYQIETSPRVFTVSAISLTRKEEDLSARVKISKFSLKKENKELLPRIKPEFRIGLAPWPGNALFYIAEHEGWFDEQDMEIKLLQVSDNKKAVQLIKSGDIDGIALSISDLIALFETGADIKGICPFVRTNGAEALIALNDSGIKTVNDLSGKTVHVDGRLGEYLLFCAAESADMPMGEIEIRSSGVRLIYQELSTGIIEAGVLWDPYMSKLLSQKKGKILFTLSENSEKIMGVLAVRPGLLEKDHRDRVVKLISVLRKTAQWLKENPDQGYGITASYLGMSRQAVAGAMEKIHFFSNNEITELIADDLDGKETMHHIFKRQETFLSEFYKGKVVIPVQELVDWTLLQNMNLKIDMGKERE